MSLFKKISVGIGIIAAIVLSSTIVFAAPSSTLFKTILPEITNTYDVGSAAQQWEHGWFNNATSSTSFYLPFVTGTQCLHVVSGQVVGTGSDCGTGSATASDWIKTFTDTAITPSTTVGIYVNASSTIAANFRVDGNATTTGNLSIGNVSYVWPTSQGSASTFLSNDGAGNLSWSSAGAGVAADWVNAFPGIDETAITPSTTKGIYIAASSTVDANFRVSKQMGVNTAVGTGDQLAVATTTAGGYQSIAGDFFNGSTLAANGSSGVVGSFSGTLSNSAFNGLGVAGVNTGTGQGNKVGVYGESLVAGTTNNFAGLFKAGGNSGVNVGVEAQIPVETNGATDVGIESRATGSETADRGARIFNQTGGANSSIGLEVLSDSTANGGGIKITGGSFMVTDNAGTGCAQWDGNGVLTNTGSACGTGSAATASDWVKLFSDTAITPSTTVGIYVNASSTIAGNFRVDGATTITGLLTGADNRLAVLNSTSTLIDTLNVAVEARNSLLHATTTDFDTLVVSGAGTVSGQFIAPDSRLAVLNATSSLIDTATIGTLTNSTFMSSPDARLATVNATTTNIGTGNVFTALNLLGITGSTQCLHVDTNGAVTGTGSDCGSGGSFVSDWITGTVNGTPILEASSTPKFALFNKSISDSIGSTFGNMFVTEFPGADPIFATSTMGTKYSTTINGSPVDLLAAVYGEASSTSATTPTSTFGVLGIGHEIGSGVFGLGYNGAAGVQGFTADTGGIGVIAQCIASDCTALVAVGNTVLQGGLDVTATTTAPIVDVTSKFINEGLEYVSIYQDATGTTIDVDTPSTLKQSYSITNNGHNSYFFLPSASQLGTTAGGVRFTFKDAGGGAGSIVGKQAIRIIPFTGDLIDGQTELDITSAYAVYGIYSDGTQWLRDQ